MKDRTPILFPEPSGQPSDARLDSWKEIATYLNRDVSTVQRWEVREGMPIHRHVHATRGSVYAFTLELDAWLQGRKLRLDSERAETEAPAPTYQKSSEIFSGSEPNTASSAAVEVAKKQKIGLGVLVMLALAATAGYGIRSLLHHRHAIPFQDFEITQLTTNGKSVLAAISPDGNYLASVVDDNGKSSLWLRHIQTNSDTQVIAPAVASYGGLRFSPDGSYIYFGKSNTSNGINGDDLFRVPVLGGTPQVVVKDIDSAPAFSPDGKRLAFVRQNDPEFYRWRLITSSLDGTEERVIGSGPISRTLIAVAWSTDGKQILGIIMPFNESAAAGSSVVSFDVASGQEHSLAAFDDLLNDMAPAPDGQGFLTLCRRKNSGFRERQIGFVSLSASKLWAVTRDTNNYVTITLSADRKTLATVQEKTEPGLYLLSAMNYAASPNQILTQQNDISDFAWASNTELYVSLGSGLLRASIDDSSNIPLITDPHAAISHVAGCVPGRFAAFAWTGHGQNQNAQNQWRVDADGSSLNQIANENYDADPVCSSDGKWLYYQEGKSGVFRVSTEDGKRQPVVGTVISGISNGIFGPDISFDGKLLAFNAEKPFPLNSGFDEMIVVVSLDSGVEPPIRMIKAIHGLNSIPRFTPDGKALVHAISEGGIDNLWLQPLDGSPGRQITNFTSGRIGRIQFSPDGQRLAVLRFHTQSNVVLLHDTGAASR